VLGAIKDKKVIDDNLREQLVKLLKEFQQTFSA
jgi:hypothetical protein